jgi:hypothetical protein
MRLQRAVILILPAIFACTASSEDETAADAVAYDSVAVEAPAPAQQQPPPDVAYDTAAAAPSRAPASAPPPSYRNGGAALVYGEFFVDSDPHPAEVYVITESLVMRDPTVLQGLNPQSEFYKGVTGTRALKLEELERSYWVIVQRDSVQERRLIRVRRGQPDTVRVQIRQR